MIVLKKDRRYCLYLLPVTLLLLAAQGHVMCQRMVVSVEMGVCRTKDISGQWRYWHNHHHKPDSLNKRTGLRDIASVYYPSIGIYDDGDTMAIDYKCQLLKMCGVDAISFCLPATGISDPWFIKKQQEHFRYMSKYGLKALPRYQAVDTAQMSGIMSMFHHPQQLTLKGMPVFSFFNADMDMQVLEAWRRSRAAKGGVFLMRRLYTDSIRLTPNFDGVYDWVGDGKDKACDTTRSPYIWYYTSAQIKRAYQYDIKKAKQLMADGSIHFYAEGVSPGFDDIPVNGWGHGPRFIERDNGKVYAYKWQQAVKNGFPMVMIPTWDDWCEGTTIAPTVEYGVSYLDITRKYVARYKGVKEPEGNLMLPVWLYRLRKSAHDTSVINVTAAASDLLAKGSFIAAEKLIMPLLARLRVQDVVYWDKAISLSALSLHKTVATGSNTESCSFSIRKTGNGDLNYTVESSVPWLQLSKLKGRVRGNSEDVITVKMFTAQLPRGCYSAQLRVSDPGACNKMQYIDVIVQVQ